MGQLHLQTPSENPPRQAIGQALRPGDRNVKGDAQAAQGFLKKVLKARHTQPPRVMNGDNNAAYPPAIKALKAEESRPEERELCPVQDLTHRVEPDHRNLKRWVHPGLGVRSFNPARRPLQGDEAMAMIRKDQVQGIEREDVTG